MTSPDIQKDLVAACACEITQETNKRQLALVACAKTQKLVIGFFAKVNMIVNLIQSTNKRQELLWNKQIAQLDKLIEEGEIESNNGMN